MFPLNDDHHDRKIRRDRHADRAAEYTFMIELQRRMRDRLARFAWERRQQAFSLSPAERQQVLRNGLDEAGKRQARKDFRCLSRKL